MNNMDTELTSELFTVYFWWMIILHPTQQEQIFDKRRQWPSNHTDWRANMPYVSERIVHAWLQLAVTPSLQICSDITRVDHDRTTLRPCSQFWLWTGEWDIQQVKGHNDLLGTRRGVQTQIQADHLFTSCTRCPPCQPGQTDHTLTPLQCWRSHFNGGIVLGHWDFGISLLSLLVIKWWMMS